MSVLSRVDLGLIAPVPLASVARAAMVREASRMVAIGGAGREIVYALGDVHRLVARDATSTWPPEAEALPDAGCIDPLLAEGVLSLSRLLIAGCGAGPPETLALLSQASVQRRRRCDRPG
jgi:iron complex transport system substrate-binding protein